MHQCMAAYMKIYMIIPNKNKTFKTKIKEKCEASRNNVFRLGVDDHSKPKYTAH